MRKPTVSLHLRVPQELMEKIIARAEKERRTPAQMATFMLEDAHAAYEQEQTPAAHPKKKA